MVSSCLYVIIRWELDQAEKILLIIAGDTAGFTDEEILAELEFSIKVILQPADALENEPHQPVRVAMLGGQRPLSPQDSESSCPGRGKEAIESRMRLPALPGSNNR
jgi:hypothetical protein